jgi:hypothetical protein
LFTFGIDRIQPAAETGLLHIDQDTMTDTFTALGSTDNSDGFGAEKTAEIMGTHDDSIGEFGFDWNDKRYCSIIAGKNRAA